MHSQSISPVCFLLLVAKGSAAVISDCKNQTWDFNTSPLFKIEGFFTANTVCVIKMIIPLDSYASVTYTKPTTCLAIISIRNFVGDEYTFDNRQSQYFSTFPPSTGEITIKMGADPERISIIAQKQSFDTFSTVNHSVFAGAQGLILGFSYYDTNVEKIQPGFIHSISSNTAKVAVTLIKTVSQDTLDSDLLNIYIFDKPLGTAPPAASLLSLYNRESFISSASTVFILCTTFIDSGRYIIINDYENIEHLSSYYFAQLAQNSAYISNVSFLLNAVKGPSACTFKKFYGSQAMILEGLTLDDPSSKLRIYAGTPKSNNSREMLGEYSSKDILYRLPQLLNQPIFTIEINKGAANLTLNELYVGSLLWASNIFKNKNSWEGFVATDNFSLPGMNQSLLSTFANGNANELSVYAKVRTPPNEAAVFGYLLYQTPDEKGPTIESFNITPSDVGRTFNFTCLNFTLSLNSIQCQCKNSTYFLSSGTLVDLRINQQKSSSYNCVHSILILVLFALLLFL